MATVNILSWNIEVLGPGRFYDPSPNGQGWSPNAFALIETVADSTIYLNANILCVLELVRSVADPWAEMMKDFLNAATFISQLNVHQINWNPIIAIALNAAKDERDDSRSATPDPSLQQLADATATGIRDLFRTRNDLLLSRRTTIYSAALEGSAALGEAIEKNLREVAASAATLLFYDNLIAEIQSEPVWDFEIIRTNHQDSYCIFYRNDMNFEVLQHSDGSAVKGLDATKEDSDELIDFQSGGGFRALPSGGRRPGYLAFKTTDPGAERIFTINVYHAMFGVGQTAVGVKSLPRMETLNRVMVDGSPKSVLACFVVGDFNHDLLSKPNDYFDLNNLGFAAVDSSQGVQARSSLIKSYRGSKSTLEDYRVSAYDHIFARNATPLRGGISGVVDMLALFRNGGDLAYFYEYFYEEYGRAQLHSIAHRRNIRPTWLDHVNHFFGISNSVRDIANLPPLTPDDVYKLYRYSVSDHLPVFAGFTV